jgi:hypothetical protein
MNLARVPGTDLRVMIQAFHDPAARKRYLDGLEKTRTRLPAFDRARAYGVFGDSVRGFAALEEAVTERDPRLEFIKLDPSFAAMRNNPRFPSLVSRMGLPP